MSFDAQNGFRLREERDRLGFSQQEVADATGVRREMLSRYERGVAEPGANVLIALAGIQIDVLYVLTGQRTPSDGALLTAEEVALVTRLRNGSPTLHGYLQEMGAAPAAGNTVSIGGNVGQSIAGDQTNTGPVSFSVGKRK